MQKDPAPEFDLQHPLASAVAVIRTVLFSPRSFYLNFKVEGPLKEPAAFVLLVGAVSGILGAGLALSTNLLFGVLGAGGRRCCLRIALADRGWLGSWSVPSLHKDLRREDVRLQGGLPDGGLRRGRPGTCMDTRTWRLRVRLRPDSADGNRHPERLRDHFLDHCGHSRGGLRTRRVGSDLAHHLRGGFLESASY